MPLVDVLSSRTHPLIKASFSSFIQTHLFPENSAKSRAESVEGESRIDFALMNLGVNVPVEFESESESARINIGGDEEVDDGCGGDEEDNREDEEVEDFGGVGGGWRSWCDFKNTAPGMLFI